MEFIEDGWFYETYCRDPKQRFCLRVEEILFHQQSKYQSILVFKSFDYGNVLVIDGVIQCTEKDEFSYQEMMAHLPLSVHPHPRKVLIVGGGDGGVVREVAKHPEVEEVHLCEIDEVVVEASRKFLPYMAVGLKSEKLTLHIRDGLEFMRDRKNEFDVIITDSSDPEGPAELLFQKEYYELMKESLTPNGIICSQGEGIWIDLAVVKEMRRFCRQVFPSVSYAQATVPTYTSGVIGFCLCSPAHGVDFSQPKRVLDPAVFNLRYYNEEVHRAAFVLPEFAQKALAELDESSKDVTTNGDS